MTLNNSLLVIPVSYGVISIIAGFIMLKFPPKKINSFYGYRTCSSMKNKESWNFAQKFSSIEMIRIGIFTTLIGLIGLIYHPEESTGIMLGLGLIFLAIVTFFIRVESAIKRRFKKENNDVQEGVK